MSGPPFKVKAVYDYSSPHEDDLNFNQDQIITVVAEEDADWYEGEYTDASGAKHSGLFPKNFVERHEPAIPSRPVRAPRPVSEVRSPPPAAPADDPVAAFKEAEDDDNDNDDSFDEPPPVPVQSKSIVEDAPAAPAQTVAPPAPQVTSPPPIGAAAPPPPPREDIKPPPPAEPPVTREAVKSPPPAPKPAPSEPAKGPPPAVSSKPSSFRDRIAAFNNAGAAPIAPFKPAAPPAGFIKKPFVAPPPSKNAYVPPPKHEPVQKVYRREEDPEIAEEQAQAEENAARAGLMPTESSAEASSAPRGEGEEIEDQPKPQSLKERIAMLQQQQMESAARKAEVAHKEKPKKPPVKKRTDESTGGGPMPAMPAPVPASTDAGDDEKEHMEQPERHVRQSLDQPLERQRTREASARGQSREPETGAVGTDPYSDANDADMSAADEATEEHDGASDSTEAASQTIPLPRAPAAPAQEPDVGEEQGATEESEQSEEDEMDAEARRRQELRERMAKMSGGMGMAGMFGPPGGMPGMMPPAKKKSKESKPESEQARTTSPSSAPRVPMIPIPGMSTVRSPESEDRQLGVEKEPEAEHSITSQRDAYEVPDVEDVKPEPPPHAELPQTRAPPPVPQDRPLTSSTNERAVPPVPAGRPGPAPPVPGGRPVPPPPPPAAAQMSPTEGEESDDEQSIVPTRQSTDLSTRSMPPPVPRPDNRRSSSITSTKRASTFGSMDVRSPPAPATPASEKRQSFIPPIPTSSPLMGSSPQTRAPPRPPPGAAPPVQAPPVPTTTAPIDEPDEGGSDYEGDYDTDIASGVKHKDALKAHGRDSRLDEPFTPVSAPIPRAVPPPPPSQPPPPTRASVDAPRAAPPPVPSRDMQMPEEDDSHDDDQYSEPPRALPIRAVPPPPPANAPAPPPVPPHQQHLGDSSDDLYSASPPRKSMDRPPPPPPVDQSRATPELPSQPPPSAYPPPPSRTSTRQSLDVGRVSMNARRSMDANRSLNDGYIATDVDLAEDSLWWAQPNMPPPVFQNRSDLLCEIEESSTPRRGGRTTISKDVYILFIDYSQTVITARFDGQNPSDVTFEQRHEAPPARLRQDQLETEWQKYGHRISEAANAKKDHVVGDGSPNALILDLLKPFKDALQPVGTRAYGALVYANLANASVQQHDEIRPGDIITLRNARLQGKHGAMHKSYSMDVGMGNASHVAVVVDWDGTKKKVRAWEQGREKPKTKMESFRLGDLRSGEVRVWRVVGRSWVGWDS